MRTHLSSNAIFQWIAGQRDEVDREHLRECERCRAEVARVEQFFSILSSSIRCWTERRTSVVSIPSRPGSVANRPVLKWGWVLPLIVMIGFILHNSGKTGSARETQRDVVLDQVEAAISRPVPEAIQPLTKLLPADKEVPER
jgi:hypothetical protein